MSIADELDIWQLCTKPYIWYNRAVGLYQTPTVYMYDYKKNRKIIVSEFTKQE